MNQFMATPIDEMFDCVRAARRIVFLFARMLKMENVRNVEDAVVQFYL